MRRLFDLRYAIPAALAVQAACLSLLPGYIGLVADPALTVSPLRLALPFLSAATGVWLFLSLLEHAAPGSVFGQPLAENRSVGGSNANSAGGE